MTADRRYWMASSRSPAWLVLAMAALGCASAHIGLRYEPTGRGPLQRTGQITIVNFKDERVSPRNSTGLCPSNIPKVFLKEGEDPARWITLAIRDELRAVGYEVATYDVAPPATAGVVIIGTLRDLRCDPYPGRPVFRPTHWAAIAIDVRVLKNGKPESLPRSYSTRLEGQTIWWATDSEFVALFERAAQKLTQEMIFDLDRLLAP